MPLWGELSFVLRVLFKLNGIVPYSTLKLTSRARIAQTMKVDVAISKAEIPSWTFHNQNRFFVSFLNLVTPVITYLQKLFEAMQIL